MGARSRGAMRPGCACISRPKERGRGECRASAAPAAPCAKGRKHTGRDGENSRKHPAFPHAMVLTAYFALSPVIGLFVTVICEFGLSAPGSSRQAFRKLDAGVEA